MTHTETTSDHGRGFDGRGEANSDLALKLEKLFEELQSSTSELTELVESHPMLVTASAFAIGLTLGLLWRSGK